MKKFSLLILSICFISTINLVAADTYTMNYNKETIGLVRKIPVYQNPAWVAKVVTQDSKEFYFISPKSFLEFFYNPKKWPSTNVNKSNTLKETVVTDYKTGKAIDAKYAFYVYGSNKISYAGDDLPAFKDIDDAKYFMKHNNGKRVLSFNQLSSGLIQLLNGDI